MSHARPTLDELRTTVQKQRYREIGNWLARRVARPTAVYGTWAAIRLGLSAHQVTVAALAASLGGAVAIGTGSRRHSWLGVALAHLGFWLDHVDGQVARWRGTACLDGVYFDYMMHHVSNLALGFSLGFGLASRSGQPAWAIAGFAIATGWALSQLAQRLPLQGLFSTSEECRAATTSLLAAAAAGLRLRAVAEAWHGSVELATLQALRAACGVDADHGAGRSGRSAPVGSGSLAGRSAFFSRPCWPRCWERHAWPARSSRGSAEAEFVRWFRPVDTSPFGDSAALGFPPTAPWTAGLPALYHQASRSYR